MPFLSERIHLATNTILLHKRGHQPLTEGANKTVRISKKLSNDTPKVHNIPNMFRINAVIWNFLLLILLNLITYSMKRLGQMWTKNVGERCLGIVANESSITDIGIK